jgi:hypothetical protein
MSKYVGAVEYGQVRYNDDDKPVYWPFYDDHHHHHCNKPAWPIWAVGALFNMRMIIQPFGQLGL